MSDKNNNDKFHVFVYGTLMSGARNHALMDGATLINTSTTTKEDSFLMLQFNSSSTLGKYSPGVKRGVQGQSLGFISGEVYEVDAKGLARLDELEQNGVRYQREEVVLRNDTTAWMYILIADDEPSELSHCIMYGDASNTYSWNRQEFNMP